MDGMIDTDAGCIEPGGPERYIVTYTHGHRTLHAGDVVVMREFACNNLLVRVRDCEIHHLTAESGQYVHLRLA